MLKAVEIMTWKRTLIPVLLFTSTNAYAAERAPTPPPDDEAPPELLELRADLAETGREGALDSKPHFRPLCDADGYPLVGNMVPKAPDDSMTGYLVELPLPPYQPSEFCTEVRADVSES